VDDDGRVVKFQNAALVLADDAVEMAQRLRKYVHGGQYERAEGLAANLQRTARDSKWLLHRLPKSNDD